MKSSQQKSDFLKLFYIGRKTNFNSMYNKPINKIFILDFRNHDVRKKLPNFQKSVEF